MTSDRGVLHEAFTETIRPFDLEISIPRLAFGTYRLKGDACKAAMTNALEAGYRHIDTAQVYKNEEDVGLAIAASSVPREDIFVTTKLSPRTPGYDAAMAECVRSRQRLGGAPIDCYLVHWPGGKGIPLESVENIRNRSETWRAMEDLVRLGHCRTIGVSNYTPQHLSELLQSCTVRPVINQVELHPWLQQPELRSYCAEQRVLLSGYSPLGEGKFLADPAVIEGSTAVACTPAQLLICWALQNAEVVVAKASSADHIYGNIRLSPTTCERARALLNNVEGETRICWNPYTVR